MKAILILLAATSLSMSGAAQAAQAAQAALPFGIKPKQPRLTSGELTRKAIELGEPTAAELEGDMATVLRKELKTKEPIYAQAVPLEKSSEKCNVVRLYLAIPTLIVTAQNPNNPNESRTGPFEIAFSSQVCD